MHLTIFISVTQLSFNPQPPTGTDCSVGHVFTACSRLCLLFLYLLFLLAPHFPPAATVPSKSIRMLRAHFDARLLYTGYILIWETWYLSVTASSLWLADITKLVSHSVRSGEVHVWIKVRWLTKTFHIFPRLGFFVEFVQWLRLFSFSLSDFSHKQLSGMF